MPRAGDNRRSSTAAGAGVGVGGAPYNDEKHLKLFVAGILTLTRIHEYGREHTVSFYWCSILLSVKRRRLLTLDIDSSPLCVGKGLTFISRNATAKRNRDCQQAENRKSER